MLRATADSLVEATRGSLVLGHGEHIVRGLSIDSRDVRVGGAFLALPGEKSDGHDHLRAAIDAGAHVLIVTRPLAELGDVEADARARGVAVILVDEAQDALADVAVWHRAGLNCRVVGITGSSGKTTTKDLLASVLSTTFRTVSTSGNRNNEIGLPLTVLSAGPDTEVLIVEMGMRGAGQIAHLCEIARPTHGLVTNVGTSHIELLGTQEAIADAKGELVGAIPQSGCVCLNGDDSYSAHLARLSAAPVRLYGLGETADVSASNVRTDEGGCAHFTLRAGGAEVPVELGTPGRHNVYNALAAGAVAVEFGVDLGNIASGLHSAVMTGMRMESFVTADGVTVINDAYNANPASMAAAVETLASQEIPGRRIAVLGDMAELGSLEPLAHFIVGEQVAASGIEVLVTIGERALRIGDGAGAAGMPVQNRFSCSTVEEVLDVLDDVAGPGDTVLVKASRVMGLESVVEGLVSPRVR